MIFPIISQIQISSSLPQFLFCWPCRAFGDAICILIITKKAGQSAISKNRILRQKAPGFRQRVLCAESVSYIIAKPPKLASTTAPSKRRGLWHCLTRHHLAHRIQQMPRFVFQSAIQHNWFGAAARNEI